MVKKGSDSPINDDPSPLYDGDSNLSEFQYILDKLKSGEINLNKEYRINGVLIPPELKPCLDSNFDIETVQEVLSKHPLLLRNPFVWGFPQRVS